MSRGPEWGGFPWLSCSDRLIYSEWEQTWDDSDEAWEAPERSPIGCLHVSGEKADAGLPPRPYCTEESPLYPHICTQVKLLWLMTWPPCSNKYHHCIWAREKKDYSSDSASHVSKEKCLNTSEHKNLYWSNDWTRTNSTADWSNYLPVCWYLRIQAADPPLRGLHPQSPRALCFASTRGCGGSGQFVSEGHSPTAQAASVNLQIQRGMREHC